MRLIHDNHIYDIPLWWVRWVYAYPDDQPRRRGLHMRFWRIGFACSWNGCGKYYGTRWRTPQATWNYGSIRWTAFYLSNFQLWLETL